MRFTVKPEEDGMLLSQLLLRYAEGFPARAVREALRLRDIRVDGERTGTDARLRAGQEVRAFFPKAYMTAKGERRLPILYRDEHVVLVEKPQGLPCQSEGDPTMGDSAAARLQAMLLAEGSDTICRLCHRLDVQTGGLLLFALDEATYEDCLTAFRERTIEKHYECLVKGTPARREAVLCGYLRKDAGNARVSVTDYPAHGAVEIRTGYRVLEAGETARLEVDLLTGRTHQIRAHLAHIGHPILGDDKYGDRTLNRRLNLRRQQLWATRMTFHTGGTLAYLEGKTFVSLCPF